MARCFIAVKFAPETAAKLSQLQAAARAIGLDATFPKELHCTLAFLGELKEKEIEEAKKRLDSIKSIAPDVQIKGVGFFPSEKFVKVFWAGARGLEALQKEIAVALDYREKERFAGHVTLARVKTQRNLEQLKKLAEEHKTTQFGAEKINEVVLYESRLTPQGPAYSPLFTKKLS